MHDRKFVLRYVLLYLLVFLSICCSCGHEKNTKKTESLSDYPLSISSSPVPIPNPTSTKHVDDNSSVVLKRELLPNPNLMDKGIRPTLNLKGTPGYKEQYQKWTSRQNLISQKILGSENGISKDDSQYTYFIEIGEKYFLHQVPNPNIEGNALVYRINDPEGNVVKKLSMEKSPSTGETTITFDFDTSKEWRNGFNLNAPLRDGTKPQYPQIHGHNHFLITQNFVSPEEDGINYSFDQRPLVKNFDSILLQAQIKLSKCKSVPGTDYKRWPGKTHIHPNHAIFHLGITICHRDYFKNRTQKTPKSYDLFFVVVPIAIVNFNGKTDVFEKWPLFSFEVRGKPVYFHYPKEYEEIEKSHDWISYKDIDMKKAVVDAIGRYNREKHENLNINDYYLKNFTFGWEIWGAWETEISVKNMSLQGISYTPM
ncbi:MAG: hypothetical protein JXX29_22420 [Deltaproteobacteria bacterium]|nr:hypothetical protein [Deltaproteobacteria bacterium]MBN2674452.1 hypothetical protein [Deltaproteobacteria bacterium]